MINAALFSSKTDDHATPDDFFEELDKEFGFVLDVCATVQNSKCQNYFTKEEDGLLRDWVHEAFDTTGHVDAAIWMNPPYGREIGKWVQKAYEEAQKGATVVCLLPARTDTKWFQDYCLPYAELRFVRGRLKFGGSKNSAPFPSVVAIFRQGQKGSLFLP
jgi:phage N-6-adenine-methyltransferase